MLGMRLSCDFVSGRTQAGFSKRHHGKGMFSDEELEQPEAYMKHTVGIVINTTWPTW